MNQWPDDVASPVLGCLGPTQTVTPRTELHCASLFGIDVHSKEHYSIAPFQKDCLKFNIRALLCIKCMEQNCNAGNCNTNMIIAAQCNTVTNMTKIPNYLGLKIKRNLLHLSTPTQVCFIHFLWFRKFLGIFWLIWLCAIFMRSSSLSKVVLNYWVNRWLFTSYRTS